MRTAVDLLFGVAGQVLTFDAPEGRPSSVTSAAVYLADVGDTTTELALAPTIEANPNTTTDAAAGASQSNPKRVPLVATTGTAIGRLFLLTNADLQKEWVDVQEVIAADAVIARHPLHDEYPAGSTFQSTRISAAVDDAWAADVANLYDDTEGNPMYRVRWVYVVAGVTYIADTYFNLVRYGARHGVTPKHVDDLAPGWIDALPIDHKVDAGRRLIDEAYREVKLDLKVRRIDDATVADAEVIDTLVRYKAIELSEWAQFLAGSSNDETRHVSAMKRYGARRDELTSNVPIRDSSGAATPAQAIGIARR
jgi:hypothetical protein